MKMKMKLLLTMGFLFAGILIFRMITGFKPLSDKKPWPVPDKDKNIANPVKTDATSIAEGKTLWAKHCQSCHGKSGMGDGSKAAQLKTEPGDFSKTETQSQSDGSLFYKSAQGRDDMPSFKKKIPDADDLWNVINFIRTLKK
jgi:mono/diheme cytochrome c family protein